MYVGPLVLHAEYALPGDQGPSQTDVGFTVAPKKYVLGPYMAIGPLTA